jgi:hypothetical protein
MINGATAPIARPFSQARSNMYGPSGGEKAERRRVREIKPRGKPTKSEVVVNTAG